MSYRYTVIIPTLNEQENLPQCLSSIQCANSDVEVIVADGGSTDKTLEIAKKENIVICQSKKGRGVQLAAGAKKATGEILLFLHADTRLKENTFLVLEDVFKNNNVEIGTFHLDFDQRHWLLKVYSFMSRFDSLFTSFGDQCIVVRRAFYEQLGGFPAWPIFEDVHFLQKARKQTSVCSLPSYVITSADKFIKNGIFRQQMKNGWMICKYIFGVSPETLYNNYYRSN